MSVTASLNPQTRSLPNLTSVEFISFQWLYILTVAHSTVSWSNAASFDPILSAEVTLKLSLLLECKAGYTDPSRVGSAELETPAFAASPEHLDSKKVIILLSLEQAEVNKSIPKLIMLESNLSGLQRK